MRRPGYHHNGFAATYALGHMTYYSDYPCFILLNLPNSWSQNKFTSLLKVVIS